MTNAEKFQQVFGVRFEEFDKENLDCQYFKAKAYKATLDSWRMKRKPLTIYVYAKNNKQAREKAIMKFGKEYRRYRNGKQPIYKLTIEQIQEVE